MPNLLRRALLAFALAAMVFACATAGATSVLAPKVKRHVPTSPRERAPTRIPKPEPTLGERAAKIALRAVGVPKPGDVLVFSGLGHVGLYVGRGRMVHAPHSGALVEVVKLGSSRYGSRIVGIRRIVRG